MPDITPQYPLSEHAGDTLIAASGRALGDITLDAAVTGELSPADLQIHAETLRAQAAVAGRAGYTQLAENLTRAAELTAVPNEELLAMYAMLRPGRSSYDELRQLAETLAATYQAPHNAEWVREAAKVYQRRGLLRRNP